MRMNVVAIDLGDKNCGLAYNTFGIIFPLPAIPRVKLIRELKKIINEKHIDTIVLGMPYDLYELKERQLQKTKQFLEKMEVIFPSQKIVEIDERYTTIEAIRILSSIEKKENIHKKKDSMSACLILESYLNRSYAKK